MTAEYYYDLATRDIIQGKVRGAATRMGPYPTREARNEQWEAEDRAWEDDEEA